MSNIDINEKNSQEQPWVIQARDTLDKSLEQLDQSLVEEISRRRVIAIQQVKKKQFLQRSSFVGAAAAASILLVMIFPFVDKNLPTNTTDDLSVMLQDYDLIENMDLLQAMEEVYADS